MTCRFLLLLTFLLPIQGCAYLGFLLNDTPSAIAPPVLTVTHKPQPSSQPATSCHRVLTDLTLPPSERRYQCRSSRDGGERLRPLNIQFRPAPAQVKASSLRTTSRVISFAAGRSSPDSLGSSMLKVITPIAAQALSIVLRGNTDKTGGTTYNDNLAGKRSLTVYNRLVAMGIDPTRISILPRDPRINARSVTVEMQFH